MSTDPALGDYVPEAGKGNARDSANLPGMGGVYNVVNFNLYHYGANNPVKYVDPDGRSPKDFHKIVDADCGDKQTYVDAITTQTISEYNPGTSVQNKTDDRYAEVFKDHTKTIAVGQSNDGNVKAIYLEGGVNLDYASGNLNLGVGAGVASASGSSKKISFFDGILKIGVSGEANAFTASASVGITEGSIGAEAGASLVDISGSLDITLFGKTYSLGVGLMGGGASIGGSIGPETSIEFGMGVGAKLFFKQQFEDAD